MIPGLSAAQGGAAAGLQSPEPRREEPPGEDGITSQESEELSEPESDQARILGPKKLEIKPQNDRRENSCQPENGPILPPPPPEPRRFDTRAIQDRPQRLPKKTFGRVNPQTHILRSPGKVKSRRGGRRSRPQKASLNGLAECTGLFSRPLKYRTVEPRLVP